MCWLLQTQTTTHPSRTYSTYTRSETQRHAYTHTHTHAHTRTNIHTVVERDTRLRAHVYTRSQAQPTHTTRPMHSNARKHTHTTHSHGVPSSTGPLHGFGLCGCACVRWVCSWVCVHERDCLNVCAGVGRVLMCMCAHVCVFVRVYGCGQAPGSELVSV